MENYTALSLFREINLLLSNDFPSQEIQSLQKLIFEKKLGLHLHQIYLNPDSPIKSEDAEKIINIVSLLKLQKPIQYILGEADFFGLNFTVNPDVLIPRQETEELIDWILKTTSIKRSSILDIGTGSGCIAISLAVNLPNSKVTAIDISPGAIDVAKINAQRNNVAIDLYKIDILDPNCKIPNQPFDIIVSNPPYVRDSEKESMKSNVLEHEPHSALFVSNDNPLKFYRNIALIAKGILNHQGVVFCEINEALGNDTFQLFLQNDFKEVELKKDLNGKDRMIKACWYEKQ